MKKTVITLLLLVASTNLIAQTFRIQSMVELTHDLSARVTPRLDAFGRECALIRINIPSIKDATFNSPIVGDPIIEPGEFSVYVPTESTDLQFECDGQSYKVDFSNYQISLQSKACYRIVLQKRTSNMVAKNAKVMITANYDNDVLLVDGIPVGQLPLLLDDISVGGHTFSVPNTQGRVLKDTIINISLKTDNVWLYLKEEEQQFAKVEMGGGGGEGWSVELDEPQWGVRIEERGGKKGLVDYAGNIIVPFQYNNKQFINQGGYYIVRQKDEEEHYLDGIFMPGIGEILPCRYNISGAYGDLRVCRGDGIYNIKTRQFVLSGKYNDFGGNVRIYDNKYIVAEDEQENTIIVDEYGNLLLTVPHRYSFNNVSFDPQEGLAVYDGSWSAQGECRVYDLYGNSYLLPSQYEFLRVTNGLLAVKDKISKKIGYLNKNMREIIPVKYSKKVHRTNDYEFSHGTVLLETDEGYTIIFNNKGEIIAQTVPGKNKSYKHLDIFHGFGDGRGDGHILCESWDGQFGVIDTAGNIVVAFTDDTIFHHGSYSTVMKKDGRYKIIDYKGNEILPLGSYKEERTDSRPLKVFALTDNNLLEYDENGILIAQIPVAKDAEFDYLHMSSDNHENQRVLIISGDNIIRRTKDDRLWLITNRKTGKCGYLSSTGELLSSCIYDELSNMIDFGNDPNDEYFKEEIYPTYSVTFNNYAASEGYGIIGLGGRYGFIDTKGNVVVPLIYTAVTPFINGVAYVRDQNNKWTKIYSRDLK